MQAAYENGEISFNITNGGNWYSNQIFLKNADLVAGKTYKLSLTIVSSVAEKITINGTVIELAVGENQVEVTYVEDASKASLSLQGGVNGGVAFAAGEFTLKNISFTEAQGGGDPVTPPAFSDKLANGDENATVANPGVWYYWNDQGWCGSNVTVSLAKYDAEANTVTVTYSGSNVACWFGMQIFYENPANEAGKTYKLTCTIISEAAGDIKINGQKVTLVAGENHIELTVVEDANNNGNDAADASFALQCGTESGTILAENNTITISGLTFTAVEEGGNEGGGNDPVVPPAAGTSYDIVFGGEGDTVTKPGEWLYWNDQNWVGSNVTVSYAHYDADTDTATFTYSGATTACWHGMQIFYKNPANETGKTYKMTCTITSEVAGDIMILGNVVTLVAGVNNIELTVGQGGTSSFALQCGNVNTGTVIAENTISISNLTFTAV